MLKLNERGITLFNLVVVTAILCLIVVGGYFGISTLIINNKRDNFINTAKKYVEAAKQQLMSDNMMPSSGEAVIMPYEQINLGKDYNSPYTGRSFVEDYSYVVIIKKAEEVKETEDEYLYYVTQMDGNNNCLNLTDFTKIDNYSNIKREYVGHGKKECRIQSISNFSNDFKLEYIDLGYDIKYSIYLKIDSEIDKYK